MTSIVYDFDALHAAFKEFKEGPVKTVVEGHHDPIFTPELIAVLGELKNELEKPYPLAGGNGQTYCNDKYWLEQMKKAYGQGYQEFDAGKWVNVDENGVKTLANGDKQHISIGRNAEAQSQLQAISEGGLPRLSTNTNLPYTYKTLSLPGKWIDDGSGYLRYCPNRTILSE